ncbi:MAG: hypothetical protein Q8Q35_04305, partial [Nanoarchaeota archaeon]|nr:hypothetical protein [Nanoarchaeota archaeon]
MFLSEMRMQSEIKINRDVPKKGNYSGKLLPLFMVIVVLIASLIGIWFFSDFNMLSNNYQSESNLELDHVLVKILLKSGESSSEQLRVMNIGDDNQEVSITSNIGDLLSFSENFFNLSPGQIKQVSLSFNSKLESKSIEYQEGVYVGELIVESTNGIDELPIVIDIESENVLFDTNVDFPNYDISPGSDIGVSVKLFNLMNQDLTNVNLK